MTVAQLRDTLNTLEGELEVYVSAPAINGVTIEFFTFDAVITSPNLDIRKQRGIMLAGARFAPEWEKLGFS